MRKKSFILVVLFLVSCCSSVSKSWSSTLPSDVAALMELKRSITPSSINPWSCLASWNFTSDPCRPLVPSHFTCGITCSSSSDATSNASFDRITSITLDPAGYSGTLSPSLSSLTSLSHLDLFDNNFHGPLPAAHLPPSLTTLILSSNSFSGPIPSSLALISTLQTLDLSRNSFTGPIPSNLPASLISLDLSFNRLSGPLPSSFPPNLLQLALRANSLSGPLTKSTFQPLTSLRVAELAGNRLGGKLEAWVFLLPSLQQLDLANNTFSSSIQLVGGGQQLLSLSRLVAIDVSFNQIEGELPAGFAVGFPLLAALSARHNRLRGQIPFQYGGRFKRLFLDGNFLNGQLPDGLLKAGDLAGSFGDNCLDHCPNTAASLCSPVQKPAWVCNQVYGAGGRRTRPRRPSPATNN